MAGFVPSGMSLIPNSQDSASNKYIDLIRTTNPFSGLADIANIYGRGKAQERADYVRNVLSEGRNAGLDINTIRANLESQGYGAKDWANASADQFTKDILDQRLFNLNTEGRTQESHDLDVKLKNAQEQRNAELHPLELRRRSLVNTGLGIDNSQKSFNLTKDKQEYKHFVSDRDLQEQAKADFVKAKRFRDLSPNAYADYISSPEGQKALQNPYFADLINRDEALAGSNMFSDSTSAGQFTTPDIPKLSDKELQGVLQNTEDTLSLLNRYGVDTSGKPYSIRDSKGEKTPYSVAGLNGDNKGGKGSSVDVDRSIRGASNYTEISHLINELAAKNGITLNDDEVDKVMKEALYRTPGSRLPFADEELKIDRPALESGIDQVVKLKDAREVAIPIQKSIDFIKANPELTPESKAKELAAINNKYLNKLQSGLVSKEQAAKDRERDVGALNAKYKSAEDAWAALNNIQRLQELLRPIQEEARKPKNIDIPTPSKDIVELRYPNNFQGTD